MYAEVYEASEEMNSLYLFFKKNDKTLLEFVILAWVFLVIVASKTQPSSHLSIQCEVFF